MTGHDIVPDCESFQLQPGILDTRKITHTTHTAHTHIHTLIHSLLTYVLTYLCMELTNHELTKVVKVNTSILAER
jgi:hypothetical protein